MVLRLLILTINERIDKTTIYNNYDRGLEL